MVANQRRTLELNLLAKNLSKGAFLEVERSLRRIRNAGRRAFDGITRVASSARTQLLGVVAAVGGTQKLIIEPAAFEAALARITLAGDGFADKIEEIQGVIEELATSTGTSREELGEGFENAAKRVRTFEEAVLLLDSANKLAALSGGTVTDSVTGLATVIENFGEDISRVDEIAAKLFETTRRLPESPQAILTEIGKLAPVARLAGLSIDDLLASIVTAEQQGVRASEALTALRTVLNRLISPSGSVREALEDIGIETGRGALEGQNFGAVLAEIYSESQRLGISLSELGLEGESISAFLAVASRGGRNFSENLDRISGSSIPEFQAAFEQVNSTTQSQIAAFRELTKVAATAFAGAYLDDLGVALGDANSRVDEVRLRAQIAGLEFRKWIEELRPAIGVSETVFETIDLGLSVIRTGVEGVVRFWDVSFASLVDITASSLLAIANTWNDFSNDVQGFLTDISPDLFGDSIRDLEIVEEKLKTIEEDIRKHNLQILYAKEEAAEELGLPKFFPLSEIRKRIADQGIGDPNESDLQVVLPAEFQRLEELKRAYKSALKERNELQERIASGDVREGAFALDSRVGTKKLERQAEEARARIREIVNGNTEEGVRLLDEEKQVEALDRIFSAYNEFAGAIEERLEGIWPEFFASTLDQIEAVSGEITRLESERDAAPIEQRAEIDLQIDDARDRIAELQLELAEFGNRTRFPVTLEFDTSQLDLTKLRLAERLREFDEKTPLRERVDNFLRDRGRVLVEQTEDIAEGIDRTRRSAAEAGPNVAAITAEIEVLSEKLEALRGAPGTEGAVEQAMNEVKGSIDALRTVTEEAGVVVGAGAGNRRAPDSTDDDEEDDEAANRAFEQMRELRDRLRQFEQRVEGAFENAFVGFVTGAKRGQEAARAFFEEVLAGIARVAAQSVSEDVGSFFGNILGSVLTSGASGGGGGGGTTTTTTPGGGTITLAAADGGVIPARPFADGGIVRSASSSPVVRAFAAGGGLDPAAFSATTSPVLRPLAQLEDSFRSSAVREVFGGSRPGGELGLFAEAGSPEAIVQLPDGESVPLRLDDGTPVVALPGGRTVPVRVTGDGLSDSDAMARLVESLEAGGGAVPPLGPGGGVLREPTLAQIPETGPGLAAIPLPIGEAIPLRVAPDGSAVVQLPKGRAIPTMGGAVERAFRGPRVAARAFADGGIVRSAVTPIPRRGAAGVGSPVQRVSADGGMRMGDSFHVQISALDGRSVERMLSSPEGRRAVEGAFRNATQTRRDFRR